MSMSIDGQPVMWREKGKRPLAAGFFGGEIDQHEGAVTGRQGTMPARWNVPAIGRHPAFAPLRSEPRLRQEPAGIGCRVPLLQLDHVKMKIFRSLIPYDMRHGFVAIAGITQIARLYPGDHRRPICCPDTETRMRQKDYHRIRGMDMHRRSVVDGHQTVQDTDIGILPNDPMMMFLFQGHGALIPRRENAAGLRQKKLTVKETNQKPWESVFPHSKNLCKISGLRDKYFSLY